MVMDSNGNLKLVFVRPIGKNVDDNFEYELIFSSKPEEVWGQFWDDNNPSQCGDISPEKTTYDKVVKMVSPMEFSVIQEFSCFSMEHAVNNIVALAWVNLNVLEEYPEYRVVLHFGDEYQHIEAYLEKAQITLKN